MRVLMALAAERRAASSNREMPERTSSYVGPSAFVGVRDDVFLRLDAMGDRYTTARSSPGGDGVAKPGSSPGFSRSDKTRWIKSPRGRIRMRRNPGARVRCILP